MTPNKRIGEIVVEFTRDRSHYSSPTARALFAGWLRTTLTSFAAERDAALEKTLRERIEAKVKEMNARHDKTDFYTDSYIDGLNTALAIITDTFKSTPSDPTV